MDAVPVSDERVWAGVQRYAVPTDCLALMSYAHAEPDVLQYFFAAVDDAEVQSLWLLNFFGRVSFICSVYRAAQALHRTDLSAPQSPEV